MSFLSSIPNLEVRVEIVLQRVVLVQGGAMRGELLAQRRAEALARLEAMGAAPATALELLKHTCAISAYLLGKRDEEEMQSAVVSALRALKFVEVGL